MSFGLRKIETPVEETMVEAAREMPSRRADHRRRVLKGANLYFNNGYGAYDCTVKNMSEGGAMVKMEDSSGLPTVFDFNLKGDTAARSATISWRKNGMAGIKFL